MLNHFGIYRHHEVYHGYSVQFSLSSTSFAADQYQRYVPIEITVYSTGSKNNCAFGVTYLGSCRYTHNVYIQIEPDNIYFEVFQLEYLLYTLYWVHSA